MRLSKALKLIISQKSINLHHIGFAFIIQHDKVLKNIDICSIYWPEPKKTNNIVG